jgi:hypothetical protein
MSILAFVVIGQLASASLTAPSLEFPEPGMDDTASYRGYVTRLYKDAAGNTLQVYLDRNEGRVVHLWADSENESIGFSVRDAQDSIPRLDWASAGGRNARAGRTRQFEYDLVARTPTLRIGHMLLGSMRVERDYQHWKFHREPLGNAPFVVDEFNRMIAALGTLDPRTRSSHLAHLGLRDTAALRARLRPVFSHSATARAWTGAAWQRTITGEDSLSLQIVVDPGLVHATRQGNVLELRSRDGRSVPFTVRITSTVPPLTPLGRDSIFSRDFLSFVDAIRAQSIESARLRHRWLDRQIRGLEALASHEKLMAGLPTYATYFGRDMLVAALMMRPIWRPEMSEFVVAAVLRKLTLDGQVSHEEALGGQAEREAASEYAALIQDYQSARARGNTRAADSLLARASAVLRDVRKVRENYHMIDDELQYPILVARWINDDRLSASRKRAFLRELERDTPRLTLLLRELALVSRMTDAYARNPVAGNLIPFAPRDSGRWASTSWRDSGAGYANGRFAMDVNAIWAPHALEAVGEILDAIRALGFNLDSIASRNPELGTETPLGRYVRDRNSLGCEHVVGGVAAFRGASLARGGGVTGVGAPRGNATGGRSLLARYHTLVRCSARLHALPRPCPRCRREAHRCREHRRRDAAVSWSTERNLQGRLIARA